MPNYDIMSRARIGDDIDAHVLSLQTSTFFPHVDMESSDRVVLTSLVAQVRGVMFYDLAVSGACYGDRIYLIRRPHDRYDANRLDVRVVRGQPYLVGHLVAPVAALLSPLMRDVSVDVSG